MPGDSPLDFLKQAQEDPKLSARVLAAVERGNTVTAGEVLQIAEEFGYSFSRSEFERSVKKDMTERFKAGDTDLAAVTVQARRKPPLSSCARGCLSYTVSWHPVNI